MGLVGKLKRGVFPYVFCLSMILSGSWNLLKTQSPLERMEEATKLKNSEKKFALALVSEAHNNQDPFRGTEERFKKDFLDSPNYDLLVKRGLNIETITDILDFYPSIKPIDSAILFFHGNMDVLGINASQKIDYSNIKSIFGKYRDSFSKDALGILYSCLTGKGKYNIAKRFSQIWAIDIVAPKYNIVSETFLEPEKRVGEFAPDENGRISFDYKNFRAYEVIDPESGVVDTVISTYPYKKRQGKREINLKGKELFSFYGKGFEKSSSESKK